jgi:hypothetical protein
MLFEKRGDISPRPEVDVVDLRKIPLTLAAQVLERGFLETRLMSEYAGLNEERSGVIEAIMERGSIYARSR